MKDNPFTLTFGKEPHLLISRGDMVNRIIETYGGENALAQSFLIEGIRGSGKTVLMTTVAKQLEEDGWIVINLNPARNLLDDFARALSRTVKRFPDLIRQGFNVSAAGFGIGVNGEENHNDSISQIEDLLQLLKKKKKRVLITIDEVLHDDNMRTFASEFQIFLREDYPVFLVMTGLYENMNSIQNDPQLTFLLRSPKEQLSPLSIPSIVREYEVTFDIAEEEAKRLAHATKGYAFAFQALGALYWEYRRKLPFEKIILKLDGMLDEYVYKKIWEGLTGQERSFLLAMQDDEMSSAKDICAKSGIKESSIAKYRERLINRGLITAPEYGKVALALPRFSHVAALY